MAEQTQTLREALEAVGWLMPETFPELNALLDLVIMGGVAVDVEAGVDEMSRYAPSHWNLTETVKSILTACGTIVPDEVVEGEAQGIPYEGWYLRVGSDCGLEGIGDWCEEGQHYTITITRKGE